MQTVRSRFCVWWLLQYRVCSFTTRPWVGRWVWSARYVEQIVRCLCRESSSGFSACSDQRGQDWLVRVVAYWQGTSEIEVGRDRVVRIATVAVENNKDCILWECVCSLRYPVCKRHVCYCDVASPNAEYVCRLSDKLQVIGNKLLYRQCVFWFCYCTGSMCFDFVIVQTVCVLILLLCRQYVFWFCYCTDSMCFDFVIVQAVRVLILLLYRQCVFWFCYCTGSVCFDFVIVQTVCVLIFSTISVRRSPF
jgi:hypothetical protein